MIVSAFTYVRNGFTYAYPFIESIKSLLPIVAEYIVVVGKGNDGTREAVAALNDPKIKIVDTVWDESLRVGGKVFAQQANIGMDHCRKDAHWLFHLQADEVVHENDLPALHHILNEYQDCKTIDGLLFPFIHFYGDYQHYCPSRRFHKYEIRVVKNDPTIRSYKDSMGFRKFSTPEKYDAATGTKLKALLAPIPVYHYSWVRPPKKMTAKWIEFHKKYTDSDDFIRDIHQRDPEGYGYREYDYLQSFNGTHPQVMEAAIAAQDWQFTYDPSRNTMSLKEKILKAVEQLSGKQLFTYKNYIKVGTAGPVLKQH